jgi:hypothetical protein
LLSAPGKGDEIRNPVALQGEELSVSSSAKRNLRRMEGSGGF